MIFLEHKLLADNWLEAMGSGGRKTVHFDVPEEGAFGPVPRKWKALPIGQAAVRRNGDDLTIVTVGVGVHRALEAAVLLEQQGIAAGVIDLRTVTPLDKETVIGALEKSGRLLVVDEDYEGFGLSGELAAVGLEAGLHFKYARVCTRETIPYARHLEDDVLPNKGRILAAAERLMSG